MEKNFFYILWFLFVLLGCSKDDFNFSENSNKFNFPTQSDEYGKAIAKELREGVKKLNEMGIDYSKVDNTPEFKQQLHRDLNKAFLMNSFKGASSINQMEIPPEVFQEKISNLTAIQIEFVERIIKNCRKSISYEDLSKKLIEINNDIHARVPEIQKERLFNITAVLYYGINEIRDLEEQGQMIPTPYNVVHPMRLKSGDESGGGDGGFWGQCREISAYVWTLAVGAVYHTGEVVKVVTWNPAYSIFFVILCFQGDTSFCESRVVECIEKVWKHENGEWIKMECQQCLQFCRRNGYWNHAACPL